MTFTGPGKSHRLGLSTKQFFKMFPDDAAAEKWFIRNRWPDGICCPRCGSTNVNTEHKHKTMPFRCRDCRKPFSTKTGTPMQASNLGYLDWMYAIYLLVTNLKSVSSMKLHRELEITQKSAWHLAHRIRKGWLLNLKISSTAPWKLMRPTSAANAAICRSPKGPSWKVGGRSTRPSLWALKTAPPRRCRPRLSPTPPAKLSRDLSWITHGLELSSTLTTQPPTSRYPTMSPSSTVFRSTSKATVIQMA